MENLHDIMFLSHSPFQQHTGLGVISILLLAKNTKRIMTLDELHLRGPVSGNSVNDDFAKSKIETSATDNSISN